MAYRFGVTLVTVLGLILSSVAPASAQDVSVKNAWIRGTVQGQGATGAFMEITAKSAARLVGAASPVAKTVEVHNMKMESGIMKMFPVDGVDLPAGKTVKLAPGGYHVMLMGVEKPLKAGDKVPLKLTFELSGKKQETVELAVEVRDLTSAPRHGH